MVPGEADVSALRRFDTFESQLIFFRIICCAQRSLDTEQKSTSFWGVISQFKEIFPRSIWHQPKFLPQGQMHNSLYKSYGCVMENATVNAAKTLCGNQMYRITLIKNPRQALSIYKHPCAVAWSIFSGIWLWSWIHMVMQIIYANQCTITQSFFCPPIKTHAEVHMATLACCQVPHWLDNMMSPL